MYISICRSHCGPNRAKAAQQQPKRLRDRPLGAQQGSLVAIDTLLLHDQCQQRQTRRSRISSREYYTTSAEGHFGVGLQCAEEKTDTSHHHSKRKLRLKEAPFSAPPGIYARRTTLLGFISLPACSLLSCCAFPPVVRCVGPALVYLTQDFVYITQDQTCAALDHARRMRK